MKQCIKCFDEKDESEYHKRPNGILFNTCKNCKNKYNRERHHKMSQNLEWRLKRSEVNKKRYHTNKHTEVTNESKRLFYLGEIPR